MEARSAQLHNNAQQHNNLTPFPRSKKQCQDVAQYLIICQMRIIQRFRVLSVCRMINDKRNFCSSCILGILNYFLKLHINHIY